MFVEMRRNGWRCHQTIHDGGGEEGDVEPPTASRLRDPSKGGPERFEGGKGRKRTSARWVQIN